MARPALSAMRAVDVMNFLAAHPNEAFSLSALADRLGINLASLHAVLTALTDRGYLVRHPRHRTYTLGPSVVAIGAVALEHNPVIQAARDAAHRLSDQLGLDVAVTARAGDDLAFIARTGIRHPRGLGLYVGHRLELRPPMGSVYYAWSDPATITQWLAKVPEAERQHDREVLAAIARQGFAVTVLAGPAADPQRPTEHLTAIDPDATYEVSSISGPVFDAEGSVPLTIVFVGFPEKLSGTDVLALGAEARDAGLLVTRQTRGSIPDALAGPTAP